MLVKLTRTENGIEAYSLQLGEEQKSVVVNAQKGYREKRKQQLQCKHRGVDLVVFHMARSSPYAVVCPSFDDFGTTPESDRIKRVFTKWNPLK